MIDKMNVVKHLHLKYYSFIDFMKASESHQYFL